MKNNLIFCLLFVLLCSCGGQKNNQQKEVTCDTLAVVEKSPMAHFLDSIGFLDIADVDSTIVIDLMYTRPDNFMGEVLYKDLNEAYLHPEAMEALLKAKQLLQEKHPDYNFIIYDATRPMRIQQMMWDMVKGTEKDIYISDPANGGGLHNYGLAVDINILDGEGKPLSMGTPVDHLGIEAHIDNEAQLVKEGKITEQDVKNRELLREVMRGAGFRTIKSEWWHFNRVSRDEAREKYQVVR
ncbi:MAG: M15 family metallopeptidase [Bacteroides sp.]|nr:M15 family metallopeptidase [Bacteroides sp.]